MADRRPLRHHPPMEFGETLVLIIVGLVLQVFLMAVAVYWGTNSIRREIYELRLLKHRELDDEFEG